MDLISYLFFHAVQMLYFHVSLNHLFPDQYPMWFLPGLYIVANSLRWFANDYGDWANYALLATTGFVYGFVGSAYSNGWQVQPALVWAFTSLICLAISYLIAYLLHYLLYDDRWKWPFAPSLMANVLMLTSLYIIWPVLSNLRQNELFFSLLILSPIVLGIVTFLIYKAFAIMMVGVSLNWFVYIIGTTLLATIALAALVTVFWWLFDHTQTISIYRASHSLIASIFLYLAFHIWMAVGPKNP